MSTTQTRATLDDLARFDGKAELIDGKVVPLMATGMRPNEVASNIYVSLRQYCRQTGQGKAFNDNMGYGVPLTPFLRESLNPDCSYYNGPLPANPMKFILGPPTFAVEVRSENDYGPAAEQEMANKRVDYFFAGTLVVWDVEPLNETIDCYRHTDPTQPVRFVRGQVAEAEPAVPGWTISVAEVFA